MFKILLTYGSEVGNVVVQLNKKKFDLVQAYN